MANIQHTKTDFNPAGMNNCKCFVLLSIFWLLVGFPAQIFARDTIIPLEIYEQPEKEHATLINKLARQYVESNPHIAIDLAQEAYQLAIKYDDEWQKMTAFEIQGDAYQKTNYHNNALDNYKQAALIAHNLGEPDLEASLLLQSAISYKTIGKYHLALNDLFRAGSLAQEVHNEPLQVKILLHLGKLFAILKDYDRALSLFDESEELLISNNDSIGLARLYNSIGELYAATRDFLLAEEYHLRAMDLYRTLENAEGIFYTYFYLGELYRLWQKPDLALEYYEKSRELSNNFAAHSELGGKIRTKVGSIYISKNKLDQAQNYLMQSLTVASNNNNIDLVGEIYQLLSDLHVKKDDFEKALFFYQKYAHLQDSLLNQKVQDNILASRLHEQATQNRLLRKNAAIQRLTLERERRNRITYGIISILTTIILMGLIIFFRIKSKDNRKLKILNTELEDIVAHRTHELEKQIQDKTMKEEELQKSEERYLLAQQAADIGYWEANAHDGKIVISKNLEELLQLKEVEKLESLDEFLAIIHADDRERVSETMKFATNTTLDSSIEFRIYSLKKEEQWFVTFIKVIRNKPDNVVRITGIIQNITTRKRFENHLRRSELKYREIIESLPIVYAEVDKEMCVTYLNESGKELTGYSEADIKNRIHLSEVFLDFDDVHKNFMLALKNQRKEMYQYQMRKRDGKLLDVLVKSLPAVDRDGNTVGIRSAVIDITDNIRVSKALKDSEEKFGELSAMLPETIFETDIKGNFTFINQNGLDMFGYSHSDFEEGINIIDLIANNDRENVKYSLAKIQSGEKIQAIEYFGQRKNGDRFPIVAYINAIFNQGKAIGVRGIATDNTERKNLELKLKESQKLQALGTLAGGIAHDFNNILMGIQLFTELAQKSNAKAEAQASHFQRIFTSLTRAKELVKQILTFSRQSGDDRQKLDIEKVILDAMHMIRSTLPSSIELELNLQPCGVVLANTSQIHQILMNLCTNASHAMNGAGKLSVSLEPLDQGEMEKSSIVPPHLEDGVLLRVSDNGMGMDSQTKERIFEPFFTTKKIGVGTGLGLATVYGIIKHYGGEITFRSELGKGTTFNIILPLVEQNVKNISLKSS